MKISRPLSGCLVLCLLLTGIAPSVTAQDEAPLTIQDITTLRRQKKNHQQIVDIAQERGVAFDMDKAMALRLTRMGFSDVHVEQIKLIREEAMKPKESPDAEQGDDAAKPDDGKPNMFVNDNAPFGPRKSDGWHDKQLSMVKEMVAASGLDLKQAPTQSFTIWATKDTAIMHANEVAKLEKILDKTFGGVFKLKECLDKRSASLVLINDDYSYKKFIEAMFDVYQKNGITFDGNDPKTMALKASAFSTGTLSIVNLTKVPIGPRSKTIVIYQAGSMMMKQLTESKSTDAMDCGFGNVCEVLMYGQPSTTSQSYEMRDVAQGNAWLDEIRKNINEGKLSKPGQVINTHSTVNMEFRQYVECWSLIQLLTSAPDKFEEFVRAVRDGKDPFATILELYKVEDEKELMKKWVKSVG